MEKEILKLRAEGKTYKQIVELLNISKSTVSYYCGEGQKEKARMRNLKVKMDICICGNKKMKVSDVCNSCYDNNKRTVVLNKKIKDFDKDKLRSYSIRRLARTFMKEQDIEKKCKICGFDHYVEVCHIKPISKFSKEQMVSEVNNLNNLVYLCPNHHILLDKGLLSL